MSHEPHPPPAIAPSRFIEKVSLVTGEVLDEPILPRQLLVKSHRDYHVVDIQARRFMGRVVAATGDERLAVRKMRRLRRLGFKTAGVIARVLGRQDPARVAAALFGLKEREYYFRYRKHPWSKAEVQARVEELQRLAAERLAAAEAAGRPALRLLITGGTGFVGQEVLWQAAHDDQIAEVVVLVRPKAVRDGKGRAAAVRSPAERGERLLDRLWLDSPALRRKFRFVAGDIEQPDLGIAAEERADLAHRLTHVVHCAASVAFDDPYETSFQANVAGTLNALAFSRTLQSAPGSRFVAHVSIETSYIHGRQVRKPAREDQIVFPRNFYNNYYELTKAMASLETERFMLEEGLRVVQLCPAIVIGEARTGNNRGDLKVVNAPVNLFGRAHQALTRARGGWLERSKVSMLARMACVFPADPSAQLNLIPVDRVAAGVLAALERPQAVGRRVHLATDHRLTSEEIQRVVREEVGVEVRLAEPTWHRTITLPVLTRLLNRFGQDRLAQALDKLGTIFSGYSEWGQPIHEVGNDVALLGLPEPRPDSEHAFRMLCRHNRWVQEFGRVRDPDEISRRERVWREFVHDLEERTGRPAGTLSAEEFRRALAERLDPGAFVLR